ncbi:hypothetical protein N9Y42_02955 [Mariniblastus sp.]|nr:hypothetical protein [Mariniblastus sp.]
MRTSVGRRGIATVELLIALPLIAVAFSTLMFLTHASHQKNDDYQAKYLAVMSRHDNEAAAANSVQSNFANRQSTSKRTASNHSELTQEPSNLVDGIIKSMFPPTNNLQTKTNQSLSYVPNFVPSNLTQTTIIEGMIYQGIGDPRNRPAGYASPSKDRVGKLAISRVGTLVGNEVGIDLGRIIKFKQLLNALFSIKLGPDTTNAINDVKKVANREIRKLKEKIQEMEKTLEGLTEKIDLIDLTDPLKEEELRDLEREVNEILGKTRNLQSDIGKIENALKGMTNSFPSS